MSSMTEAVRAGFRRFDQAQNVYRGERLDKMFVPGGLVIQPIGTEGAARENRIRSAYRNGYEKQGYQKMYPDRQKWKYYVMRHHTCCDCFPNQ